MEKLMIFIGGGVFGIIAVMFIAFVDSKVSDAVGKDFGFKQKQSKFKFYLMATCWELQFLGIGILLGWLLS